MYSLFFWNEFELSNTHSRAAHLCLSSSQPSRYLVDSDSPWAAIIRVTVPHVSLTETAWLLAVEHADGLVSAANSLTLLKRNLVCILTHLRGTKVQLLFGHSEGKQVSCWLFSFRLEYMGFSQNVVLYWCWLMSILFHCFFLVWFVQWGVYSSFFMFQVDLF